MNNLPLVSVLCAAYNHEKYIEDALKGFVNQETNFPFEVIVHDDASTDNTAEIIKEYEKKYPEIIKPIYQKENQYSRNVRITKDILLPNAKGKYVALCEGDDFWIDKQKLQKQVNYMENNPDCNLTIHPANIITNEKIVQQTRYWDKEVNLRVEFIIDKGGGGGIIIPTASMVVKRDIAVQWPKWRVTADIGDYPLQILSALTGTVHYLPDVMCCYRQGHAGSWTSRRSGNKEYLASHVLKMIKMQIELNDYTNDKYQSTISRKIFDYFQVLKKENCLQVDNKLLKIYSDMESELVKSQEKIIFKFAGKLSNYQKSKEAK